MKFYVKNNLRNHMGINPNSFVLVKDSWDDWFKFETQYYAYFFDSQCQKTELGYVKIGQMNMKQRSADLPEEFEMLSEDYFSLGQTDEYYENIKILGDRLRKEILQALNDIAFNLDKYKAVRSFEVTKISLMREVSDFMIKQQFHRIAIGKARLTDYDIEYTYPKYGDQDPEKLTFTVLPESNPPTNIHVIVGRNNVGKTYFIKNLIRSIYRLDDSEDYGTLRSSNSFTGRLNSKTQAFANVLFVSFSPFDDFSTINETAAKHKKIPYSFIGLTNDNLQQTLTRNFSDSLLKCQKSISKLGILKSTLEILESDPIFERSNLIEFLLQNGTGQKYEHEVIFNEQVYKCEAERIFQRLSSGHQVILLTVIQLIDYITERSLIILDEPENHLHPPLLSAFIRALSQLLYEKNGVAIITTHSPVILQEVPSRCIWKINRTGENVAVNRLDIESFGASIGSLTREVFGLEVRRSGFHKILSDEVNEGQSYNDILEKFDNQLGEEALFLLRTLIALRDNNETSE